MSNWLETLDTARIRNNNNKIKNKNIFYGEASGSTQEVAV